MFTCTRVYEYVQGRRHQRSWGSWRTSRQICASVLWARRSCPLSCSMKRCVHVRVRVRARARVSVRVHVHVRVLVRVRVRVRVYICVCASALWTWLSCSLCCSSKRCDTCINYMRVCGCVCVCVCVCVNICVCKYMCVCV